MDKKYSIFRMRNGKNGNRVIFPETHADAVHTTKNRRFVNTDQLELINSLIDSPLLDYNSEEQKTKFNKLLELADNTRNIQMFLNNVQVDDIKTLQSQMNLLQPLLSGNTLEQLITLLNQPNKYDLAVVPGQDGQYYTLSVNKTTNEEGLEVFKEIYTPYEPSTTNTNLGSVYTPKVYEAQTEWKVPAGVENLRLEIPLSYSALVYDNSLRNGQIDTWYSIQENSEKLMITEYNQNDLVNPIITPKAKNSKPYFWATWDLKTYLTPILQQLYNKEDIEEEYQTFIASIKNFEEKITYRPIENSSTVNFQPFINNTYYTGHIEQNGDNTELLNQEITPSDVGMAYNNINSQFLLNGDKNTIAFLLFADEENTFEFKEPKLILEVQNPFVGKTLVATKANDHFDLSDWKIKE